MKIPLLPLLLLAAATLARGDETTGLVLPFKEVQVSASLPLAEVIETMAVKEGDTVQKDQLLVQLRDAKEKLAVQEGQKLVENAEFVWKGADALARDRMGSKEIALKSKTEWELAKIRLATAEEQLKEKAIRAPLAGTVVKTYKEAGEAVDRGEKLVDVLDFDQVLVQFYLAPKYLSALKEGDAMPVQIPDLGPARTGKIYFIDPRIDASSGLFRVKVLLENADHKIKPGMKASAKFSGN